MSVLWGQTIAISMLPVLMSLAAGTVCAMLALEDQDKAALVIFFFMFGSWEWGARGVLIWAF